MTDSIDSIDGLRQDLEAARASGDMRAQIDALRDLANMQARLTHMTEAARYAEEALDLLRQTDDLAAQADLLITLARIKANPRQYQEALAHLISAQSLALRLGDRQLELAALIVTGRIRTMVDPLQAVETFRQVLTLARELHLRLEELLALEGLGQVYERLSQMPEAVEHYQAALKIAQNLADVAKQGALQLTLGNIHGDAGDFDQAIAAFRSASTVLWASDRRLAARALGNLALTYARQGQVTDALSTFKQSRDAFAEAQALADVEQVTRFITALEEGEIDLFKPPHLLNLERARQADDAAAELAALDEVMSYHVERGEMRQVIHYGEQKRDLAQQEGDPVAEGDALGDLGTAYMVLGDQEAALQAQTRALDVAREQGDWRGEQISLNSLIHTYAQIGLPDQVADLSRQALDLARQTANRAEEIKALGSLGVALQ
ncbi:MAG: tetratricopeptide repeat protein, partial [Chloroflexi bacterium]|nr:tetratricopeptide repeat protein [Chloroflexota bacterium]